MDTIQLNMTADQKAFVEEQVTVEGHVSSGDFLVSLIEAARKKRAWEKAEQLVMDGMATPVRPLTKEDWRQLHDGIKQKADAKP